MDVSALQASGAIWGVAMAGEGNGTQSASASFEHTIVFSGLGIAMRGGVALIGRLVATLGHVAILGWTGVAMLG